MLIICGFILRSNQFLEANPNPNPNSTHLASLWLRFYYHLLVIRCKLQRMLSFLRSLSTVLSFTVFGLIGELLLLLPLLPLLWHVLIDEANDQTFI